ncbi:MAG: hypothetical protein FRX48_09426 [Lasallia pustulata]|uniref:DNA polymerase delta subunit 4 n=1 Tax=Lasallia pustulata TaxID=136370 RepID=A0A5M8PCB2_9LECA|nr:MAG: hypothetical protein FRX48_09426 [Lasallia pustulata]
MPATRRKPSNPTPRAQQTLSFNTRSAKVTKPSLPASSKKLGKTQPLTKVIETQDDVTSPSLSEDVDAQIEEEPTTAESAIEQQAKKEIEVLKRSAEEERAAKVSEAQIKRYWKGKEDERKAPRVHQQDLSLHEKILRHFDLSSQYGPCIGIARMKRWKRAQNLGLEPPIEVLAVLLKEEGKNNTRAERAHVDELMSSRFIIN